MIKDVIIAIVNPLVLRSNLETWPVAVATASPRARFSILQFFAAGIANAHTRRAYLRAAEDFFRFVAPVTGGQRLETITSLHVASWLEALKARGLALPTIKLRLAAIRMLFEALVRDQILGVDPTAAVRGPAYRVTRGKTPMIDGGEVARLLEAIDASCASAPGQALTQVTPIGVRDRAIIATMAYSFARVSAVTALTVASVFRQRQRLWLRLKEKGGRTTDVPCHHALEEMLTAWLQVLGPDVPPDAPLFQTFATTGRRVDGTRSPSGQPMSQSMTWAMVQRRARAAGIDTAICNHSFRAAGITAYLKNGGTIERAAVIAGHASTRTTQLYDRRPDDVTLDEIEKIRFG